HGVATGLRLGLAERLERGLDGRLDVAGDSGQGAVEGGLNDGGEQVVAHGGGGAAGDEGPGVGLGEVDALAGLPAEKLAGQLNEQAVSVGGSARRPAGGEAWRPPRRARLEPSPGWV